MARAYAIKALKAPSDLTGWTALHGDVAAMVLRLADTGPPAAATVDPHVAAMDLEGDPATAPEEATAVALAAHLLRAGTVVDEVGTVRRQA